MELLPGIDWIWTIGLAVAGILILVTNGINKRTIITGPFLIAASLSSLLRQTDRLSLSKEIPILVIVLGTLMLISNHPKISQPKLPENEK
jgi:hypothetical protein